MNTGSADDGRSGWASIMRSAERHHVPGTNPNRLLRLRPQHFCSMPLADPNDLFDIRRSRRW